MKGFLYRKNDTQISGFAFLKKARFPRIFFCFFFEQILSASLCIISYGMQIFLKVNGSRDISIFGNFTVPKIVLQKKVIDKTQMTKNQENSANVLGKII